MELANKKPYVDATPLPPLNFAKMGQQWPMTQTRPVQIAMASFVNILAIPIARTTFSPSSRITIAPTFFPNTLPALVPPKLPDPY